jgi:hypothetical protein
MNSYPKILGTIFVLTTVMTMSPFLINIQANAIDIDFDDFKCIAMVGQNVSCDEDNDVNITDSFNPVTTPVQICGNNFGGSTSINDTSTCSMGDIDVSNGSPSTLGLS